MEQQSFTDRIKSKHDSHDSLDNWDNLVTRLPAEASALAMKDLHRQPGVLDIQLCHGQLCTQNREF